MEIYHEKVILLISMAVLTPNDLILLNSDSVLHKIVHVLCSMHCCLNEK